MRKIQPNKADGTAGRLIVIVGPSGAGKDSLMDYVRAALADDPQFGIVRRVITRDADAGGEAHEPASDEEFAAMKAAGRFAVDWRAHDLSYGIPIATLSALAMGKTLLVNGSRSALPAFRAAFGNIQTVLVTARSNVLASRLAKRGRETEAEILERLAQKTDDDVSAYDLVIDNNGALAEAGEVLLDFVCHKP